MHGLLAVLCLLPVSVFAQTELSALGDPNDPVFRAASWLLHQNALDDGIGLERGTDRYFPWIEEMRLFLLNKMKFNDTKPMLPPGPDPRNKCETRELFLASQNISRSVEYDKLIPPSADIRDGHVMYYADFNMAFEFPLLIQIASGPVLDIPPESFLGWCYRHTVCGLPPLESNTPYMNLPRVKPHKILTHMHTETKITFDWKNGELTLVADPVVIVDDFRIQGCVYPDYINSTYGRDIPKEIQRQAQLAMNEAIANANRRFNMKQEFRAMEDVYVRYWLAAKPLTYSATPDYSGKNKGVVAIFDAEVFATPMLGNHTRARYNSTWFPRQTVGHAEDADIATPANFTHWDTSYSRVDDSFFLNGLKLSSTFMMGMMWGANVTGKIDITDQFQTLDANMSRHMNYEQPFVGIPAKDVLDIVIDYGQINITCTSCYPHEPSPETGYGNQMILFNVSNIVSHGYVKYNGDDAPGFRVVLTEIEKDNMDIVVIAPRFPLPRPVVNKLAAGAVVKMMRVWNGMFALHPILFPNQAIEYLPNPTVNLYNQKTVPACCGDRHGYVDIVSHCINHVVHYPNGTLSRWPRCQRLTPPRTERHALLASSGTAATVTTTSAVAEDSARALAHAGPVPIVHVQEVQPQHSQKLLLPASERLSASSVAGAGDVESESMLPTLGGLFVSFFEEPQCQLVQSTDMMHTTFLPVTTLSCHAMNVVGHPYLADRYYAMGTLQRDKYGVYRTMVNISCKMDKEERLCYDCDFVELSVSAGDCVAPTNPAKTCLEGPGGGLCMSAYFSAIDLPCLGPARVQLNEHQSNTMFLQMFETDDCTVVPPDDITGHVARIANVGPQGSCAGALHNVTNRTSSAFVGVYASAVPSSFSFSHAVYGVTTASRAEALLEADAASAGFAGEFAPPPQFDVRMDCAKSTCDEAQCGTIFTNVPLNTCQKTFVGGARSVKLVSVQAMLPGCKPLEGGASSAWVWIEAVAAAVAAAIVIAVLVSYLGNCVCLRRKWSSFQNEYWDKEQAAANAALRERLLNQHAALDQLQNESRTFAQRHRCLSMTAALFCGCGRSMCTSVSDAARTVVHAFGFRKFDPIERLQVYMMFIAGGAMVPNMLMWFAASPYKIFKSETIKYIGLPTARLDLTKLNDTWDWWAASSQVYNTYCFSLLGLAFVLRFILKNPSSYTFWRNFRVLAITAMLFGNIVLIVGPGFFTKFKDLVVLAPGFISGPEDRESHDQLQSLLGNIYAATCTSYIANLVLFLFHGMPTAVCGSCALLCLWAVNQTRLTPSLAARIRLAMIGIAMLTPMVILLGLVLQYHMLNANPQWMMVFLAGFTLNLLAAGHLRHVMTQAQTGFYSTVRSSLHIMLNAFFVLGYFGAGCVYLFYIQHEYRFDLRFCMSMVGSTFFAVSALVWLLLLEQQVSREQPTSVKYQTVGHDAVFFPLKVDWNKTTEGDFEAVHVGTDRLEDQELDRRQEEIAEQHYVSTAVPSAITVIANKYYAQKAAQEHEAALASAAAQVNGEGVTPVLTATDYEDTEWTDDAVSLRAPGAAGTLVNAAEGEDDLRVKDALDDDDDFDETARLTRYTGRCPLPMCDSACIFLLALKDFIFEARESSNPIKYGFRVNQRRSFLLMAFICSTYCELHWLTTTLQKSVKQQLIESFEEGGWGVDWKWPAQQDGGDFFDTAIASYEKAVWIKFACHVFSILAMFWMLIVDVKGLGYKGLDNSRYLGYLAGAAALTGTLLPALPNYKTMLGSEGQGLDGIIAWCAPEFNHAGEMIIGGTAGMFLAALFLSQLFGLMISTPIAITRVGAKLLQTGAKFSGAQRRDWMPVHNVTTLRFMLVFGNMITPLVLTIPLIFYYQSMGDQVTKGLTFCFFILPLFWSFFITRARSYGMLVVGYYSWLFTFLGSLFGIAIYTAQKQGKLQKLIDEMFKIEHILGVVAEICISNVIVSDILLHVIVSDARKKDGKIVPVNL